MNVPVNVPEYVTGPWDAVQEFARVHPIQTFFGINPALLTLSFAVFILFLALAWRHKWDPSKRIMLCAITITAYAGLQATLILVSLLTIAFMPRHESFSIASIVVTLIVACAVNIPLLNMLEKRWNLN